MDLTVDSIPLLIIRVVVILVGSFIFVSLLNALIERVAEDRTRMKGPLVQVRRFSQLVVYSLAVILVLWTLNIDITGLVAGLGLGALVIGFALKDLIENWVSGLLLISGRTYRIGDVIQVDKLKGTVKDISLRTTILKTYDRNEVIIPNSVLLRQTITNLTCGEKETVTSLIFSIDYVYDIEKAKKAIECVLRGHPKVVVSEERRREIRFIVQNKEWTTEIQSLFWINEPESEEFIKSELSELVKRKLDNEGILPPIPAGLRKEYLP